MITKRNSRSSEFLDSLLTGDRNICSKIVHEQLNNHTSIKEIYENTIKINMYEVGELWEYNKISVATEHLASAIVEAVLNELYPSIISQDKNERNVILTCVENELHQIGIKMVSDIFELNSWNSYFLGANTPISELISFTKDIKPDIIAISLSIYFNHTTLEKMIKQIRNEFPDLFILVGGQAFLRGGHEIVNQYSNVKYLPDLNSIDLFIKNLE